MGNVVGRNINKLVDHRQVKTMDQMVGNCGGITEKINVQIQETKMNSEIIKSDPGEAAPYCNI